MTTLPVAVLAALPDAVFDAHVAEVPTRALMRQGATGLQVVHRMSRAELERRATKKTPFEDVAFLAAATQDVAFLRDLLLTDTRKNVASAALLNPVCPTDLLTAGLRAAPIGEMREVLGQAPLGTVLDALADDRALLVRVAGAAFSGDRFVRNLADLLEALPVEDWVASLRGEITARALVAVVLTDTRTFSPDLTVEQVVSLAGQLRIDPASPDWADAQLRDKLAVLVSRRTPAPQVLAQLPWRELASRMVSAGIKLSVTDLTDCGSAHVADPTFVATLMSTMVRTGLVLDAATAQYVLGRGLSLGPQAEHVITDEGLSVVLAELTASSHAEPGTAVSSMLLAAVRHGSPEQVRTALAAAPAHWAWPRWLDDAVARHAVRVDTVGALEMSRAIARPAHAVAVLFTHAASLAGPAEAADVEALIDRLCELAPHASGQHAQGLLRMASTSPAVRAALAAMPSAQDKVGWAQALATAAYWIGADVDPQVRRDLLQVLEQPLDPYTRFWDVQSATNLPVVLRTLPVDEVPWLRQHAPSAAAFTARAATRDVPPVRAALAGDLPARMLSSQETMAPSAVAVLADHLGDDLPAWSTALSLLDEWTGTVSELAESALLLAAMNQEHGVAAIEHAADGEAVSPAAPGSGRVVRVSRRADARAADRGAQASPDAVPADTPSSPTR